MKNENLTSEWFYTAYQNGQELFSYSETELDNSSYDKEELEELGIINNLIKNKKRLKSNVNENSDSTACKSLRNKSKKRRFIIEDEEITISKSTKRK